MLQQCLDTREELVKDSSTEENEGKAQKLVVSEGPVQCASLTENTQDELNAKEYTRDPSAWELEAGGS